VAPIEIADLCQLNEYLAARVGPPDPLPIRRVLVADDAIDQLVDLVRHEHDSSGRSVCLVMDRTVMHRAGEPIKPVLLEKLHGAVRAVERIELGTKATPPTASLALAEDLSRRLPPGGVLVSFGSGTITDLAKHAAFLAGKRDRSGTCRWICCPTACTVTAYSSSMAVLLIDGVKRTLPSRLPDAIVADLQLLAGAPLELTRAGFGDMMARSVSYGDWYLAHLAGMDETFQTLPFELLAHADRRLFASAAALRLPDAASIRVLVDALLLAGAAMSLAGTTTPISGWEHAISHCLDLYATAQGRRLGLHGAQVGAATLVSARVYADLLATDALESQAPRRPLDPAAARGQLEAAFGKLDPTGRIIRQLWEDYRPKWERFCTSSEPMDRLRQALQQDSVRRRLCGFLRPAEQIEAAMHAIGAPTDLAVAAGLEDPGLAIDAVRHLRSTPSDTPTSSASGSAWVTCSARPTGSTNRTSADGWGKANRQEQSCRWLSRPNSFPQKMDAPSGWKERCLRDLRHLLRKVYAGRGRLYCLSYIMTLLRCQANSSRKTENSRKGGTHDGGPDDSGLGHRPGFDRLGDRHQ